MAYFSPYFDRKGIHMPTYEDRLEALSEEYRNIFGAEAELSESVPDYQLLSVFAKALDDLCGVALKAYYSRTPVYAAGGDLDLLLPLYGLEREEGETDAEVRARISRALADPPDRNGVISVLDAAARVEGVEDVTVYENNGDDQDYNLLQPNTIAVVKLGGADSAVAQAVFDSKSPGLRMKGTSAVTVQDPWGGDAGVLLTSCIPAYYDVHVSLSAEDADARPLIESTAVAAVLDCVNTNHIGSPFAVPSLYGAVCNADPELADRYYISDLYLTLEGDTSHEIRGTIGCSWNKRVAVRDDAHVYVSWV